MILLWDERVGVRNVGVAIYGPQLHGSSSLDVHPQNSNLLVTASYREERPLQLWDIRMGASVEKAQQAMNTSTYSASSSFSSAVKKEKALVHAFEPDAEQAAGSAFNMLPHGACLYSAQFSADGRRISIGGSTMDGKHGFVRSVTLDGKKGSGSWEDDWLINESINNPSGNHAADNCFDVTGLDGAVNGISWTNKTAGADDKMVSVGKDGVVRMYSWS